MIEPAKRSISRLSFSSMSRLESSANVPGGATRGSSVGIRFVLTSGSNPFRFATLPPGGRLPHPLRGAPQTGALAFRRILRTDAPVLLAFMRWIRRNDLGALLLDEVRHIVKKIHQPVARQPTHPIA